MSLPVWPIELDHPDPGHHPRTIRDDERAQHVLGLLEAVGAGVSVDESMLLREAVEAGIAGPWRHASHRPQAVVAALEPAEVTVSLLRIAAEHLPEVGDQSPERFLGPWAAPLRREVELPVLQTAVAAGALVRWHRPRRPIEWWDSERPSHDRQVRRLLTAVSRAPLGLWRLEPAANDRWWLHDLVGFAPGFVPDHEVRLSATVGLDGGAPRAGAILAARLVQTHTEWLAMTPFVVGWAPSRQVVSSWVTAALWKRRLTRPGITVEAALASSAVLCRRVHEAWWLHRTEAHSSVTGAIPPRPR